MASSLTRIVRGLTYCVNRSIYRLSSTSSIEGRRQTEESPVDASVDELNTTANFATEPETQDGELMNARSVPRDWTSQKRLLQLESTRQPARPKQLVAAMLGAPNSGKSTLANTLVGRKVCRCEVLVNGMIGQGHDDDNLHRVEGA